MTLIEWSEMFKTGVEEMDSQHKVLINMINHVHNLLEAGKREEAKEYFRKEIVAYVEEHFSCEEKFLESINYPELETHKKAHENFRKIMMQALRKVEEGDEHEFQTCIALAWSWLYSHILKVDSKYGKYYKSMNDPA